MTTEKCHSVCLLVYDIIFFSPKNRPCKRLSLPIKSDDDSIKCNQDDFTQLPAKTSLQNIQNNVQNDYYSEMSDDSDNQSVLDGGDYLWIPNTLACHMGIHRHSRFLQVSV